MGKTKEGKKEKKEKKVEDEVMEDTPKKEKKEKKRKLEEAEVAPASDKKEKKKKKKDKEPEEEVEAPKSEKKEKKKKKEKTEEEAPKKEKKEKKKKAKSSDDESEEEKTPKKAAAADSDDEDEPVMKIKNQDTKKADAIAAVTSTKVFFGNLSFRIDDDSFKAAVEPLSGKVVSIKWMEDRETGKFRGSGIIEFESCEAAGKAALLGPEGTEGADIMGRPVRTRIWEERANTTPKREPSKLSDRPDNCTTVFCGNLSFDIDDDKMTAFFKEAGEVKQIRWLINKETGEFRGCGFVEFYDSDAVDNAVKMNGNTCEGRTIRLDYSAPRPPREY